MGYFFSHTKKAKEKISKNNARYWLGKHHSKKTKQKISLMKTNPSLETRSKMSLAKKGKPMSEKARNARRHPLSEKTKKKMRLSACRGKNHRWFKHGLTETQPYKSFQKMKHKALKRGNGGIHTFEEWENLKKKYNYMCLCCKQKEPFIKLTEDHIIPLIKGGSNDISNIQPLCFSCNSRKYINVIDFRFLYAEA